MRLVLLGTGGLLPTDNHQTACYFIPEVGVMLDAGHGLYRLAMYIQTERLDIYLTHAHGDHTSGLDYVFASALKAQIDSSPEPLNESNIGGFVQKANDLLPKTCIHADKATLAIVQPRYEMYNYDWRSLQTEEPLPNGGNLTHFRMENDTTGFRLDWPGHSMAYITDTIARPDSSYIEHIRGVDLLLHDCNGPDHLVKLTDRIGHSHTSAVIEVALLAGVKRLILIHHGPIDSLQYSGDLDRARKIFPAIEVGYDCMEVTF